MRLFQITLALCLLFPGFPVFAQDSAQSLVDSLSSLAELHEQGVLSESEFNAAKRRLLGLPVEEKKAGAVENNQTSALNALEEGSRSLQEGENVISNECMSVFEKDINLLLRRRSIFGAYRFEILPYALAAAAEAVDGRDEGRDGAIRDQLIAERNQKLNQVDDERDVLLYENAHCLDF